MAGLLSALIIASVLASLYLELDESSLSYNSALLADAAGSLA